MNKNDLRKTLHIRELKISSLCENCKTTPRRRFYSGIIIFAQHIKKCFKTQFQLLSGFGFVTIN